MQTPYALDQGNVEGLINALRGPQPVQLAGDVVQLPVIPTENAGPSANTLEEQRNLARPHFKGGSNITGVPKETILRWLTSPSSQGKVYTPPMAMPLRVSPPLLGGPDMPPGGGGGFLPPRL